jgi:hypothetical protein
MKRLGINYAQGVPQSISDSWDFWCCENVPHELPTFLLEIKKGPLEYIGWGLSEKMATELDNILTQQNA